MGSPGVPFCACIARDLFLPALGGRQGHFPQSCRYPAYVSRVPLALAGVPVVFALLPVAIGYGSWGLLWWRWGQDSECVALENRDEFVGRIILDAGEAWQTR